MESLRRSRYTLMSDLAIGGQRLLLHGVTGAMDEVADQVGAFLKDTSLSVEEGVQKYNISQETLRVMEERGYLTKLAEDQERQRVGKYITKLHTLKLENCASFMIVVTYLCNLRCHYCFQKPLVEADGKRLFSDLISVEMVDAAFAAMAQLIKQKRARHNLELFGGEPLLARNRPVVQYIIEQARERNFSVTATSNSTDLHHYEDLLGPGGIEKIQVTIDGAPEMHDKIRIYPSGKGSFESISDNISRALDRGVVINLRINIAKYNIQQLPTIVEHIQQKGWAKYENFAAGLAEVHYIGIQDDRSKELSHLELIDSVAALDAPYFTKKALVRGVFGRHFNYFPGQPPAPKFDTCFCNAMQGHYVFDPYGNVYTCTEDVGFERARVGTYYPGALQFDALRLKGWHERTVANLPDCPSCEYLQVCGGGCARNALLDTGDAWTSYCTDFKAYFQKVLTLLYEDYKSSDGPDPAVLGLSSMVTACKS
ncbi:MAG: radical SAM protein [Acidobacteria bacterium]|nr:radical SAM protein [Acidobacteriota bacterium]